MIYPKNPYCPMNGDCGCPGNGTGSNGGNNGTGNNTGSGNTGNNGNNNNHWPDNNTQWPDTNRPDNNRPGNNCPDNWQDNWQDNTGNGNMTKSEMMRRISELDFAITDLNLYLDTHPDNKEALEMLTKLAATVKSLKADYTQRYGPLLVTDVMNETPFSWVSPEHKWPWQA